MKKANVGVQYAPFDKAVHAGRLNTAGNLFLDKADVTADAIAAVGRMAIATGDGEMTYDFSRSNGRVMRVTVTAEEIG